MSPDQIKAATDSLKILAQEYSASHNGILIIQRDPLADKAQNFYFANSHSTIIVIPSHFTEAQYFEALAHEVGHMLNNLKTPDIQPPKESENPQQFAKNEIKAEATAKALSDAYNIPRPNSDKYMKDWEEKRGLSEQEGNDAKAAGQDAAKQLGEVFSVGDLISDPKNAFNNMLPGWAKDWLNDVGNALNNLLPDWARPWFGLNREGTANFIVGYFDPITLDLDGDGIETIGQSGTGGVMFDHDADGIKNPTGWVHKDDGLLVFDRNGDGIINNGSELFGDSTLLANGEKAEHGFAALADLDSNGDGVIDAKDAAFSQLKVWRDLNGDGISQADELFSLKDLGIASLNLEYKNVNVGLAGNNQLAQIGSYTKTDGTTGQMGDVNFNFDQLANGFIDKIELTPEQEKAANIEGMGRLRDLREAAALSPILANLLEAYSNATTKEAQLALLPGLLEAWARTDSKFNDKFNEISFDVAKQNGNSSNTVVGDANTSITLSKELEARWQNLPLLVAIMDSFTNMTTEKLAYTSVAEATRICEVIENSFAQLFQANYDALLLQTRLKPYIDAIGLTIKDGQFSLDFASVEAEFEKAFIKDPKNAFVDLGEFLASQGDASKWINGVALFVRYAEYAQNQNQQVNWLNLLGAEAINKLGFKMGSSGNDSLTGSTSLNNILFGGAGNDVITGRGIFSGGSGNDIINATVAGSDDTFLFNIGDGQDIIYNAGGNDKIVFGKDVTSDMISYRKVGNNLIVVVGNKGDQITLVNYFDAIQYGSGSLSGTYAYQTTNRFEFADGTVWADIRKQVFTQYFSDANNNIVGSAFDDAIYAGSGDDIITDNYGNNYLDGGAGNDIITGRGTFNGGTGNDIINATVAGSDDTFLFNIGDGQDIIYNAGGNDKIVFGKDVTSDMISYRKVGNNLIVVVGNKGDQITLVNYFDAIQYGSGSLSGTYAYQTTNRFEFADGTVWADIRKQVFTQYFSDANNNIVGSAFDDAIYAGSGDDIITDNYGNNYLDGGAGNDIITGRGTFNGGTGNDIINATVAGSDDTFLFNIGDGQDIIYNAGGNDKIVFGKDVTSDMISYRKVGNNLIVVVGNKGDQITLVNYFDAIQYGSGSLSGTYAYQTTNRFEFADGTVWADIRKQVFTQYFSDANNNIVGSAFDDAIYAGSGDDIITDNYGNNYLDGGAGNDIITGRGTFNGGTGNDIINATVAGSDDTFLFNIGDGQDIIYNAGGNDKIVFGKDVTSDMISYRKVGNNLIVVVGNKGDQITLVKYFDAGQYDSGSLSGTYAYQTTNRFEFADGTVWADIRKRAFTQYYSNDDNTITGVPFFNNEIYAGSGNDTITTGSGNDIISGGAGNDILNGGAGNDTYLFENSHGKDIINDSAGNDTISFTGDQHAENLWFSRQGSNLLIETLGTTDSITVSNWFSNANYQIETIQLSNGQALINQQVQSLINAMASFAPAAGSSIDVATQKQDYLTQIGISSYWNK